MSGQPNPMQGLIIAVAVTMSMLGTAVTLFVTGLFQKLGLVPTIAIITADLLTVVVIWILYGFGKLGPRQ